MANLTFENAFIDPQKFGEGVAKLQEHITNLSKSFDQLGQDIKSKTITAVTELKKEINSLSITQEDGRKKIEQYQKEMTRITDENKKLTEQLKKYEEELKKASEDVKKLTTATNQLEKSTSNSSKAVKKKNENLAQLLVRYLRTTLIITEMYKMYRRLTNGINDAFFSMVEFDKANKQTQAVTRATTEEAKKLREEAQKLGATTEYTATEISNLQKELGKLGFNPQEIINATSAIANLATATGEDLQSAARVTATTLRAFGLEATETERLANVMAGSFVRSGLNLERFGEGMKYVAPLAADLNLDIETTTVLLSRLADSGVRGTQAGTSLRTIFANLANPTSNLALRLGYTVNSSEDLIKAFRDLSEGGVEFADATQLVEKTARTAFSILIKKADTLGKIQEEYRALDLEGRKLAFTMRDTLANDIEILKSSLDALGRNTSTFIDQLGQSGQFFRDVVQGTTSSISKLSNAFELMVDGTDRAGGSLKLFGEALGSIIVGLGSPQFAARLFPNLENDNLEIERMQKNIPNLIESYRAQIAVMVANGEELDENNEKFKEIALTINNTKESYENQIKVLDEIIKEKRKLGLELLEEQSKVKYGTKEYKDYDKELKAVNSDIDKLTTSIFVQRTGLRLLEQSVISAKNSTVEFAKIAEITKETLNKSGKETTDFNLKLTATKAKTDELVSSLQLLAAQNDITFIDQANTIKTITNERINQAKEELAIRIAQIKEMEGSLGSKRMAEKILAEEQKTNAEINRLRLEELGQLRNISQRRADLINQSLLDQLNTELKIAQLAKDNSLRLAEDRLVDAKKFYDIKLRIIQVEEDRETEILKESLKNRQITQEVYDQRVISIQQKFLQQRLDRHQSYTLDVFRLEQELVNRIEQERKRLLDADLNIQRMELSQQESAVNKRLSLMAIERRGIELFHNRKKKLFEEELELKLQVLKREADINKEAANAAMQAEMFELNQRLKAGQTTELNFQKERAKILQTYSEKIRTINQDAADQMEITFEETNAAIKLSFQETFESIGFIVMDATDKLFTLINNKRKAELDSLKKWEDARLEYVKGNAEAEALIRLQAEQKRIEIERKQARDARNKAIFDVKLNTATAISKTIAINGMPAAIPLIALASALGAAQLAAILSAPLPEFYKGTSNAPEGLAKVDERGQELIFRKKRNTLELGTNRGTRVTHLDKGDQVYTASQTKKILNDTTNLTGNHDIANRITNRTTQPIKVTDEDKIINGVARALSSLPITQTNMDERGFSKYLTNKKKRVETLNKRYKF